MFHTFIFQPIFNLLVAIYAFLPGHNFGLAIIIFTVVVRLLMWPLVKKQLHHAKAMKALQPELKRIKKEAAGNKQQESAMLMALYKEREINPAASIGILIVQLPILIALYQGITKIVANQQAILDQSYGFIKHLGGLEHIVAGGKVDKTLLGFVDLSRSAIGKNGAWYIPALVIAVLSAAGQYLQSKQLMPTDKNAKTLRSILRKTGDGDVADQSEISAAVGRSTQYLIPAVLLIVALRLASALPLYWLAGSVVAYIQQAKVLNTDETELEQLSGESSPIKTPRKHIPSISKVVTKPKPTTGSKTTVVIRGPGSKIKKG